jgi:hypothetical protein
MTFDSLEPRDTPSRGLAAYGYEPAVIAAFGEQYESAFFLVDGQFRAAVAGGAGAGPRVAVYDGAGAAVASFFAGGIDGDTYRGGLHLLAAGRTLVVRPADPGAGVVVSAYSLDGTPVGGPYLGLAGDAAYRGGATVAAYDVTGDRRPDLIVAAAVPGEDRSRVCVLDAATGALFSSVYTAHRVLGYVPAGLGVKVTPGPVRAGDVLGYAVDTTAGVEAYDAFGRPADLHGLS